MDDDPSAVLLDRDGTINVEMEYLSNPADVDLLPNAAEGLRMMQTAGHKLVIITNQSGVGRGYFSLEDLEAVNRRLLHLLSSRGVTIDGVYCCVHAPDVGCICRKPRAGLVQQAAEELGFDPARGYVIGDKASDIQLSKAVGAQSILVLTGYGTWTNRNCDATPDHVAGDLVQAARLITKTS